VCVCTSVSNIRSSISNKQINQTAKFGIWARRGSEQTLTLQNSRNCHQMTLNLTENTDLRLETRIATWKFTILLQDYQD